LKSPFSWISPSNARDIRSSGADRALASVAAGAHLGGDPAERRLDAHDISVTTTDGIVQLHGRVHSLWEKRIAEEAAASAPGVHEVRNELIVTP
jgi:hypothetical protein